jgi:hypothetical protein
LFICMMFQTQSFLVGMRNFLVISEELCGLN